MIDQPGITIARAAQVEEMEHKDKESAEAVERAREEAWRGSLAGHIATIFQENKDARSTSGMEEKMLQSLRAYNGHYDPEDVKKIREFGGSEIYMNLTPTKCRAAMSWIREI